MQMILQACERYVRRRFLFANKKFKYEREKVKIMKVTLEMLKNVKFSENETENAVVVYENKNLFLMYCKTGPDEWEKFEKGRMVFEGNSEEIFKELENKEVRLHGFEEILKMKAYVLDTDDLTLLNMKANEKHVLIGMNDFVNLVKDNRYVQIDSQNLFKKHVFEYAPKGFVCYAGSYALISVPEEAVSPYDENEKIHVALAVNMADEVIDRKWAQTYKLYWFGDEMEPSMIGQEDLIEISESIFVRRMKKC